ncbi:MFS transporter, partial [SAR202 cluster bacterium AD-802-E10_MRT_200m]|nr:MFS transporter [SAR202 cluster bacterium AD-802-E10_MRT_200m]
MNYSSFPVYFLPLAREFHTSYAQISLAFSLRAIGDIIGGPIGGILVDKKGPRFMVLVGMLAGGIGFIVLSFTQSYMQFLLVLTCLISLSFSMPDHGVNAGINMWFKRRLGIAMSVASSGFSLGGLLLTPLVAWLVLNFDWRWAASSSGVIMILIGVPAALIFRYPKPGETDEEDNFPNTETSHGGQSCDETHKSTPILEPIITREFSFSEAMRTQTYWLLGIALALRLLAQITLMIHFVPILVLKDIPEGTSAILIAIASFFRLPIAVIVGYISDRWSRTKTSAFIMFLGVGACATVLFGPNYFGVGLLFALLFGAAHGANAITWAL